MKRRLQLNRQSIQVLSNTMLGHVNGGWIRPPISWSCPQPPPSSSNCPKDELKI